MSDDLEFARTRKRTPKPDQGEDNREKRGGNRTEYRTANHI